MTQPSNTGNAWDFEQSAQPPIREPMEKRQPSRALRALSSCNRALLRATNEPELLDEVCRGLAESGGYRLVFIAFARRDKQRSLVPVAKGGVDNGYLDSLRISWDDSPYGKGPAETAFRSGRACIVQDIECDAEFRPWREEAEKRGFASVITLPLMEAGSAFGILSFMSSEPNSFDALEAELLADFAANLSYAIIALRSRQHQEKTRMAFSQQSQQLRALAARLQAAREEERTMVARELHDELGQSLTALKMDLSWIRSKLQSNDQALAERLQSSLALVSRAITWMRKTCTELRPGVLDDLGLAAAIEWQAGEFETHSGIPTRVEVPDHEPKLSSDQSTAIFRIFQEALTNVARHAQARLVEVTLAEQRGFLKLTVKDDGVGLAGDMLSQKNSFGLLGMRERALVLGGELRISSSPRQGTTISVAIPLTNVAEVSQEEHAHPRRR